MKDKINTDHNPSDSWIDAREASIDLVREERRKQFVKWGVRTYLYGTWIKVIGKEFGEVCEAMLNEEFGPMDTEQAHAKIREEAVHLAAVSLALIQQID